ncbi:hypothetical protein U9M48_004722 [Paspalum notatum var. saurae]|uniref:SWIM-type domain-containing protein n=1 Tax=Paspalum notatum var. saurae TaxID=547442 RepID=A0AAQ3PTV4_PASNO
MSKCIVEGGVADIYVEEGTTAEEDSKMANVSDFEDELVDMEAVDADESASEEEQGGGAVVVQPPRRKETREEIERQIKRFLEMSMVQKRMRRQGAKATSYVDFEGGGDDTAYEQTDEDESVEEIGSDGELKRRKDFYKRYNSENPTPSFEIGMKFRGKKEFKEAVVRYCLSERKVVKYLKDDDLRVRVKCEWAHCPWICLCSKHSSSDSWQIATLIDEHTCPPRKDNKHVTAQRIAEKYEKFILSNPSWNFLHMKNTVQEEMFVDVSLSKLKRAKSIVMKKALDARKGQYEKLYDYQLELLRSNLGSTVVINKEDNMDPPVFRRMAGCRKVIGLDGCFFKGATSGELLCALGRDSNNQMYPVAWAVVDKENNDNWSWFCDLLPRDIKMEGGKDGVIISDQQKGIINAVQLWAPETEHRNCARHIYANWKKEFNDKEWQKLFWGCAKTPNTVLFNHARAKLAQKTRAGAQAILNTHPQHWSRAWFRFTVDLVKKECSCRYWQLSGLSCPHAISSIYYKTNSLDEYVADCYKVEQFKKIYSHCLEPVEGMHSWPVSDRPKLKAPGYIRMPGRPKTERRREPQEKPKAKKMSRMGIRIRCTKCKGVGHNRASCDKKNAGASTQNASASNHVSQGTQHDNQSVAHSIVAIIPQSQARAESNSRKRNNSLTLTPASQASSTGTSAQHKATKRTCTKEHRAKAMGRVATAQGGTASMNLQARGADSQATSSVSVNITSGKASAKAVVHGAPKKTSTRKMSSNNAMMMLPPWDSAKL